MIKHLTILTALTLSVSAFDNAYLAEVSEGIKNYHAEVMTYNTPAHAIPMVETIEKSQTETPIVTKEEKVTVVNRSPTCM